MAAILRRRARGIKVTIVEPAEEHYYQPAFTLVGAGVYPLAKTHRPEASVMPSGVQWIRSAAKTFEPEHNTVVLQNGDELGYDYLVVCTGVKLDWDKVTGLAETLGTNGVCSNYSPKSVSYTWECVQKLKAGDKIVCTQPPMPFKCPGAPQKIAYLIADRLRRRGILKDCTTRLLHPCTRDFRRALFRPRVGQGRRPLRHQRELSAAAGGRERQRQDRDVRIRRR